MISLVVALLLQAAPLPMSEVWPYKAKRGADGTLEYSYDLTVVKLGSGSADAKALHGDDKVSAFLKSLPRTVKVKVPPGSPVSVGAGRALEPGPLSASFAASGEGPLEIDNPIARRPGARLRPPFDPVEPKVLAGAEMVLWQVRELEEAALVAVELETEAFRRELWSRVGERALSRFKQGQGDAREGAMVLAARVVAASACLDRARVPAQLRADRELNTAVEAEIQRRLGDPDVFAAPLPWAATHELTCSWVRTRAMGQPFENSRAGTAAVLLFLDALEREPKLRAKWERIRKRRDVFLGAPVEEPVLKWQQSAAGDASKQLDNLSEFIESMPLAQRTPPPLISLAVSPFVNFMSELSGPERQSMLEDLAQAVSDGRVAPSDATWPSARDSELVPLAATENVKGLQFDASWRDRLVGAFALLQGLPHDGRANANDLEAVSGERSELTIRLQVPPMLEVEPLPAVYEQASTSLERLLNALAAENLMSLHALSVEGRRSGETILADVRKLQPVLRGLAKLAAIDLASGEGRDVAEARKYLATWRSEVALARDVRRATASPIAAGSERAHTAILGVGRRELALSYASKPKASLEGPKGPFELNTEAEQRYIVPVLVSASSSVSPAIRALDRSVVRTLVDGSGRDRTRSEGAFVEALSAP